MTALLMGADPAVDVTRTHRHRTLRMTAMSLVAAAGTAGAVQLWEGTYAPSQGDVRG